MNVLDLWPQPTIVHYDLYRRCPPYRRVAASAVRAVSKPPIVSVDHTCAHFGDVGIDLPSGMRFSTAFRSVVAHLVERIGYPATRVVLGRDFVLVRTVPAADLDTAAVVLGSMARHDLRLTPAQRAILEGEREEW